uniref:Reverse transcriptase domain-containing protein n=1 Tax=Salix viminalis TaxID=40686 RepID=A0A6N2LKD6_SALVM
MTVEREFDLRCIGYVSDLDIRFGLWYGCGGVASSRIHFSGRVISFHWMALGITMFALKYLFVRGGLFLCWNVSNDNGPLHKLDSMELRRESSKLMNLASLRTARTERLPRLNGTYGIYGRPNVAQSTSVSASSTSESSESRRIIQSEEITFEDFTKHLDNWNIPSISQSQIYKKSKYDIFKTDFTIKTEERDIQLTKPFETIQLLTQKSLQKHLDRNYKYIHIGCVQVGIKPLTKEGLNTSVLAVLRDARFINFEDSLLSSIESSLCNGPLSFDCYPNLTVSLKDKNILKSMQLQIKTHNYHMIQDSIPVALIFKIHYKAMHSAFASKHLQHSNKGTTLLLQTDISKANIVIPKAIQWNEITLPEKWILEEATPPQPIPQPEPNVQIRNITQYNDGRVELSFHRHSTSSRYTEASSSSSTIDLGRMSRIPSVINLPYMPPTNPPRHSTSDIPSTNLHHADYTTNIPTPVYIPEEEQSLPGSPTSITSSAMPNNELLTITSENFVLDKLFFKADFFSDQNAERRNWFFKTFTSERSKIQTAFYDYITLHQSSMLFFDWFELHYASVHNIAYPFTPTKHACPVTTRSKASTWNLSSGQTIESEHPPMRNLQIEHQNGQQLTRVEKYLQRASTSTAGTTITKPSVEPKLKNPVFKPFQLTKTSLVHFRENQTDFLKQVQTQLQSLDGPSLTVQETPQISTSETNVDMATSKDNLGPDITISSEPNILNQHKYNATSLYEWNIDGMSEYNILNTLQQMTMAANAYKTQTGTPDRAIAELLIAGFSGQLKGWWDYHLTEADHLHILNAIQHYEDKTPVLDSSGNTVQDAVACLILTISLHFIGDPSHLKDKNAELLSNLRCKKLSDFQWYKNTFMTRVMLREDSNQPFWKEKFLAGLPILLGEKVRNKIKDTFSTKLIPYDQLTYGELVSFTQKEGLQICQDLKLQKLLKWEMKRTKQELVEAVQSPNTIMNPKHHTKDHLTNTANTTNPNTTPKNPSNPTTKTLQKIHQTYKTFHSNKPFDWKNATCFKCHQKGHTSKFCTVQKKLHELNIDEATINMLQNLYLEASDTDPSSSDISEEEFQVDELADSSATSDTSKSNEVSVLTQDQEFILEAIKRLDDPQLQRVYLDNLLKNFNKAEQSSVNPHPPPLTKPQTTQQKDSAILQNLLSKVENQSDSDSEPESIDPDLHALHDTNLEQIDTAFLDVLSQISSKKYIVKLSLVFSDDFKLDTIALFDTGADLNCIKEGVVPKRFLQNTNEKLSAANSSKLDIAGKTQASVLNNGISVTTFFVATKDINHTITSTHSLTCLLHIKIADLQSKIEQELCSDLPTAFWKRKQHVVDLPYEDTFSEKQIPTKARPIQMNAELEQHCRLEIQDLESKEIERGTPRLVINYKPLNSALKWIRYPIPNKKDLLQKLHAAFIFSKFDMKSGFWQIQIDPKDRYKTAFTVPFGQYEWNVMPFGLKNAPSEFQRIMNDIFNAYSTFCIVYIDDVLIFSHSIDQHFKHLHTFFHIAKQNGLVISKSKISLFQTRVRFLGHYISQGTITPIERSLEFTSKFPDRITDKTQLQRFLGSLNYVLDFYPNLIRIAKPLHDRLKKSPEAWSDIHTQVVRTIKAQVQSIPLLHLADPLAPKIVETDASDIGYGGILKQVHNSKESIIAYTSAHWNDCQKNYSTVKKEILSIITSPENSYKTNPLVLMPPRPQRDKGKAPAKPTKTQTPKNPVLTSPKLLADAIKDIKETKSWYDKTTQEEDEYSSLKNAKTEDISNEIVIRISKNPGLLEAINKGYRDFASDSQSLSDGFPDHNVHSTIASIFPTNFHFKSWDISKSQSFYENILQVTGSVTFKHFFKHPSHPDPAYSTCTIQRIISPEKWSRTLPFTPILFPTDIQKQNPHFPSYTYWDYEQAWFNAFLIQNQGHSHSWLFFFNTTIDTSSLPHWFQHWWDMFGCIPELLPNHPSVEEGFKFFKAAYRPIPSERRFKPITMFCAKFFLPWVCSWYYDYSSKDGSTILIRRFRVKWWDAFRKEPQCSLKAVEDWFKNQSLLPAIPQNSQTQFLAQKAKTAALLASAQTQEDYDKILQSLALPRDESVSSNDSSSSSASSPVISLGNDNEDDCYGILPPVKHSSKEVIKRR